MTQFDRTTRVHAVDDAGLAYMAQAGERVTRKFHADLDPSWGSLLAVHGGYLTSLTVRAAQSVLPDRDVRTVSTSFLRPASIGPVDIEVEVLRSGRSFSTVIAHSRQSGRDIADTRITMLAPLQTPTAPAWTAPIAARPAPRDECVDFEPPSGAGHFDQAQFRIDPNTIPVGGADDARVAGHVRPLETRPIDAAWLVVMGDWFPPAPFRRLAFPIGGISIDYTIHLHRTLPADPEMWLEGVFTSNTNSAGIALEHGQLATPDGDPVAETFHTRWTG